MCDLPLSAATILNAQRIGRGVEFVKLNPAYNADETNHQGFQPERLKGRNGSLLGNLCF